MLTRQHIAGIRQLLGRATLQGSEVAQFVEIANALTEHEDQLIAFEQKAAKKAARGKQDVSPAS